MSIHSVEENHFVHIQAARSNFVTNLWLGLDDAANGVAKWLDESTVDFLGYGGGEPNFANELCVTMGYKGYGDDQGKWTDRSCQFVLPLTCKRKAFGLYIIYNPLFISLRMHLSKFVCGNMPGFLATFRSRNLLFCLSPPKARHMRAVLPCIDAALNQTLKVQAVFSKLTAVFCLIRYV